MIGLIAGTGLAAIVFGVVNANPLAMLAGILMIWYAVSEMNRADN